MNGDPLVARNEKLIRTIPNLENNPLS